MTKKGQPLTKMGRLKLRKLRARGRARNWHLSRRVVRETLEARRASTGRWFDRQVGKMLGEVFSKENLRRAAPFATLGEPTIQVRSVKL